VPLLHRIFQSRSLRLDGQLSAAGAPSWTSGLLIGTDVAGALPLFAMPDSPVHIVANAQLCQLYGAALTKAGRESVAIPGEDASFAGLAQVMELNS
jgi:2-dehydro-3-deoxygalactonokinase